MILLLLYAASLRASAEALTCDTVTMANAFGRGYKLPYLQYSGLYCKYGLVPFEMVMLFTDLL